MLKFFLITIIFFSVFITGQAHADDIPITEAEADPLGKNGGNESVILDVEKTPEIIIENEEFDSDEEQFNIQINEKFFGNIASFWPHLIIIIAGTVGGIIVIKIRYLRKDEKFSDDDEYEDNSLTEDAPLTQNFQDMQADTQQDYENSPHTERIIETKVSMISELQENEIGDYEKLEDIKNLLIGGGSFTLEDNYYLETKYEEYKKMAKKNSEEEIAH